MKAQTNRARFGNLHYKGYRRYHKNPFLGADNSTATIARKGKARWFFNNRGLFNPSTGRKKRKELVSVNCFYLFGGYGHTS